MIDKTDVCIVSKTGELPIGLEHVPVNKLIIETSYPLGEARRKAISRVTTEYFAFIDDDIEISKFWFKNLSSYLEDNIVAVWGYVYYKGLGFLEPYIQPIQIKKILKNNERFNTNNCIIKTETVRDWVPSYPELSCFEDYEIGKHVMNKGYSVIFVPSDTIHNKDWKSVKKSCIWNGSTWIKVYRPNAIGVFVHIFKLLFYPFYSPCI